MSREAAVLITLILYKIVLVVIGLLSQRRTKDGLDFFLAGRKLGPMVAAISASASSSSGWTLLGVSYLLPGLVLRKQELRIPGLALLILCVLKALFMDLTGLELPYRVLSYTVLGALLVLSSYGYVRLEGALDAEEAREPGRDVLPETTGAA